MEVGEGRLHTFLCERNFYFFSPYVKYVFDFRRPPLFLVPVGDSKSRLQGKDETTIKTALLFVPVRVAVPEVSYNKVPLFQKTFRSA